MPTLCQILEHTPTAITFRVDNVEPTAKRERTYSLHRRMEGIYERPLLACSHPESFQITYIRDVHPLIDAVHTAFSDHLPLRLTPDAIWLTIAEGFAQHVNQHAEELRYQFVSHAGQEKLAAFSWEEDPKKIGWPAVVKQWDRLMEPFLLPAARDLLLCDFSTTAPTIRTASRIVMMDTFSRYFVYLLLTGCGMPQITLCGIPQITLCGTPSDWRRIQERVERMGCFGLEWWTIHLLPLCRQFVATAEGRPDLAFWKEICKPEKQYGASNITGWIGQLFPYIHGERNPLCLKPREELTAADGVSTDSFPDALRAAQVNAASALTPDQQSNPLLLLGGFLGVTQESTTGEMAPEIGWAVIPDDPMPRLLAYLAEHFTPAPAGEPGEFREYENVPGQARMLSERFLTGEFFRDTEHPWRLPASPDWRRAQLPDQKRVHELCCWLELADGRVIAVGDVWMGFGRRETHPWHQHHWCVMVGLPVSLPHAEYGDERTELAESRMIATDVVDFLQRLKAANGAYYFDAPHFIPPVFPPEVKASFEDPDRDENPTAPTARLLEDDKD